MFRRKKEEKDQEERLPVAAPPPAAPSIPVFRAPPPTPQLRAASVARPMEQAPEPARPAAPAPVSSAVGKQLTVGQGIFLSGEITACDRVLVEGTVEATLTESRNLEVLAAGVFSGHADIETADIAGRFDGEITVSGKLVIRATGRVVGKVRYGQVSIEAGGEIAGEVQVLPPTVQAARPAGGHGEELLDRDYLAEQKAS